MKLKELIKEFMINGGYIPFISFFIYLLTDDIYLPIFLFLKLFTANYYYNFSHLYPNPETYKWRHMIRLTDTGHIAAFMFYFNKKTTPIAHNVHFIIDTTYYITKYMLGMKDTDKYKTENKVFHFLNFFHQNTNHCLSYILIVYYMINNQEKNYTFDNYTLLYTYLWLYVWLFFIYAPWVLLTNDYLYDILEPSKPLYCRLGVILFVNVLAYISNSFGKLII